MENTSHFGQTRKIDISEFKINGNINEQYLFSPIKNENELETSYHDVDAKPVGGGDG